EHASGTALGYTGLPLERLAVLGQPGTDEERMMRGEVKNERHRFAALRRQHRSNQNNVLRDFDHVDGARTAVFQGVAGQFVPAQGSVGKKFKDNLFPGLKRNVQLASLQSVGARLTVDRQT